MYDLYESAIVNRNFSDLNPVSCGRQECAPGHSFGPHMRDYYLLHYVTRGCGVFFRDGNAHPVRQGQFFIIRPHELTTYTADARRPWYASQESSGSCHAEEAQGVCWPHASAYCPGPEASVLPVLTRPGVNHV